MVAGKYSWCENSIFSLPLGSLNLPRIGSRLDIAAAYESLTNRFPQWIDNLRLNKMVRIEGLDDGRRHGGLHGRLNAAGGITKNQPPVPLVEAVEYTPDAQPNGEQKTEGSRSRIIHS